jgi:hypothetical protein
MQCPKNSDTSATSLFLLLLFLLFLQHASCGGDHPQGLDRKVTKILGVTDQSSPRNSPRGTGLTFIHVVPYPLRIEHVPDILLQLDFSRYNYRRKRDLPPAATPIYIIDTRAETSATT